MKHQKKFGWYFQTTKNLKTHLKKTPGTEDLKYLKFVLSQHVTVLCLKNLEFARKISNL